MTYQDLLYPTFFVREFPATAVQPQMHEVEQDLSYLQSWDFFPSNLVMSQIPEPLGNNYIMRTKQM